MNRLESLNQRMKTIVTGTCNTVGCNDCGLKWQEDGVERCSATELQGQIMDIEMGEFFDKEKA